MTVYLDSSVVLRPLLAQPNRLTTWGSWDAAYASELLGIECRRVIDRLRLEGLFDDKQVALAGEQLAQIERTIARVRLTASIVREASRTMPTIVKTFDAIHLATAIVLRDRRAIDLVFATHDDQQATAARAMGFSTIGLNP
jgi:predicted nucleic acid-binding protein